MAKSSFYVLKVHMTSSPFFSKIRRDEMIRMIYVLAEMDKNFQRYLASNTPKISFFKIMAGRKEAGSNLPFDVIVGGSRNAAYKNNTKI